MSIIDKLKTMVIEGDLDQIRGVTEEAVKKGADPQQIIDGLIAAYGYSGRPICLRRSVYSGNDALCEDHGGQHKRRSSADGRACR